MPKSLLQLSYVVAGSDSVRHYVDDTPSTSVTKTFGGIQITAAQLVGAVSVPQGVPAVTQIGNYLGCDSIVLVDSSSVLQLRSLQSEVLTALRNYVTSKNNKFVAQNSLKETSVKVTALYKQVRSTAVNPCINC